MGRPESFFSPDSLVSELRADGRSLNLPENSVEPIIEKVLRAVLTWMENRDIITKSDLKRTVGLNLKNIQKTSRSFMKTEKK